MNILTAFLLVFAVAVLLGILLLLFSHLFKVEENPLKQEVRAHLPGVNCGACGYKGCDDYASAVAEGTAKPNLCIPGGDGTSREIADIMGLAAADVVEQVAYVACNGLCLPEEKKYYYDGPRTCKAANMSYQGDNFCSFACLGYGDCIKVCPRDAICINDRGVATIDPRKCIGCGLCAKECPNSIIHLIRDTARVAVTCNNHYKGAQVRMYCKNGCIACGKCEKVCPSAAITVKDNLAAIDYEKCVNCGACREACPVKCIHEGNFICGAHFE